MEISNSEKRKWLTNFSLGVLLLTATLWDFRLFGFRIFDAAALLACFVILLNNLTIIKYVKIDKVFWPPIALITLWSIYGYWSYSHFSSSVIVVGLLLLVFLLSQQQIYRALPKFIPIVLAMHLAVFWFQFISFYFFDYYIDYFTLFDGESRNFSHPIALTNFRASGLFQEANSFSLCVFMLASLCLSLQGRFGVFLIMLAVISMLWSQSLWGTVAAISLLSALIVIKIGLNLNFILIMVGSFTVISSSFVGYLYWHHTIENATPQLINRIEQVFSSGSFRERFVSNTISKEQIAIWQKKSERDWSEHPEREYWEGEISKFKKRYKQQQMNRDKNAALMSNSLVGHGLSTKPFIYGLPLNSYSFFWNSLGIMGILGLLFSMLAIVKRCKIEFSVTMVSYVGFGMLILFTYPIFTYGFFWIWLFAGILQLSSQVRNKKQTSTL